MRVKCDTIKADLPDVGKALEKAGAGPTAYANAVGVYAGITVSRQANRPRWFNLAD